MVVVRASEVRALDEKGIEEKLAQVKRELHEEIGLIARGGRATNPGRIKELKRTVARMLTIAHERKKGIAKKVKERKKSGGG